MILVTGTLWLKQGHRSIGVVSQELAMAAQNEALITLYTPGSTAEPVKDLVETLIKKSVAVSLVVNDWNRQPQHLRNTIMRLKRRSPLLLKIYDFKAADHGILHAKAFVVDKKQAVIGSSNISWSGVHRNYEIAVLLSGSDAESVAQLFYAVIRSPLCEEITGDKKLN